MGFLAAPPRTEVRGAYLPFGWDDGWKAARRAAATTPAQLVMIGDSVTSGQSGASAVDNPQDWLNDSYYGVLRDTLAPRVHGGLGAEFFGLNESVLRNAFYHDGLAGATPHAPVTYNDGVLGGHDFGWTVNHNGWWWHAVSVSDTTAWTNANTWMVRFVSPYTDVVRVEAIYANYFGTNNGTFQYGTVADGTGKTSTGAIPLVTAGGYETVRRTVWSGAASQPTVYLGQQSAGQTLGLLGFIAYRNLTGGLYMARHAFTGNTLGTLTWAESGSGFPLDRVKQLVGGFDGSTYTAVGFPTAPHLLIHALGINDCNRTLAESSGQSADPWHYELALRGIVEAGRRARPAMSILFLMPFYPPQDYADTSGFAQNDSWTEYVAAAMKVAQEYGCAVLSVNERWGSTAFARGFVATTDGHPITAGYADMAAFLAEVL